MDLDNVFLDPDGLLYYHQRMHKIYTTMIGYQLPSVTGEGKIIMTDSTYGYLLNLVIDGKSEQNSTPLPYSISPIENVLNPSFGLYDTSPTPKILIINPI